MRGARRFRNAGYKRANRSIGVSLIIVASIVLSSGGSIAAVVVGVGSTSPLSAGIASQPVSQSGDSSTGLVPVDEFYSNGEPFSAPGDEEGAPAPYLTPGDEEGQPAPYPTPPPRFPCGPNGIENRAWGGAPSGFLGALGALVAPNCPSYLRRPRRRPFISCGAFTSNEGFLRLVDYDAAALTARTYGTRTRGYGGALLSDIRQVCVQVVSGKLQLTTPDGVFELTRINDFTKMVPRQSYGHEAYSPEALSQYKVKVIRYAKGVLLRGGIKYTVIGFNQTIDGNNQLIGYDAYYYAAPNQPDGGQTELKSESWLDSIYVRRYWEGR